MPIIYPGLLAAVVLGALFALGLARRDRIRWMSRRVLDEVLSHRLGAERRLVVADAAWRRAAPAMRRVNPALAREIDTYYLLAARARVAIDEPVPLRLASRPGEVAAFWRERQRLAMRLRAVLGLKEAALTPSKRGLGGHVEHGIPVGSGHLGLPGRGRHRTGRLVGLRAHDRRGLRRGG